MKQLPEKVVNFFQEQGCVVISTIDEHGFPHSSCKDIIKVENSGKVYLLDAYKGKTFDNLKSNSKSNITAFDEHKFTGFCLKGKAHLVSSQGLNKETIKAWEDKITSRLARRLLKNIHEDKGRSIHPEAALPRPQNMIVLEVEEVIDLAPHNLRQE
jgi:uncharacterized pyridoxamine 5'-phosphate oxidase family protein